MDIIEHHLPSTGEKRNKPGGVPNGVVTKEARLSMAIRYFAGGDPLDIADIHGVSPIEVVRSVWDVVDAIHLSPELKITFPETWEEQTETMLGFKSKSRIGIDCCFGAIDGMLVWMNKPTVHDQLALGFGPTKFFCGRKMKYGLNMLGVCDSKRRFIWLEVRFPGAASDFYAFDDSHLKKKLDEVGFVRPGFCLFGDNAYVNSPYMCTTWRNVSSGPKDAYNYFHSQVRISIECAFGVLVHRWGVLRKPMPVNLSVLKISSMVLALGKLHNFCIDHGCEEMESPSARDVMNITMDGGLFFPRMDNRRDAVWEYDYNINSADRMDDLLDGGEHTEDHTTAQRRKYRHDKDLPCHRILADVCKHDYERPEPSRRRMQNK